jgi:tetratricopeptide (TPR) repeat protein
MGRAMTQSTVFLGALTTHRLVGRKAELAALQKVIFPDDRRSFQCLILQARGGKGKTRLLRETYERLGMERSTNPDHGSWATEGVIALPLIDLGDVALQPVVGFMREVRQGFGHVLSTHKAAFAHFDAAWLNYELARDGQVDFDTVHRRTQELLNAFESDYRALIERVRVIWVLDTLEQLFSLPPEIVTLLDEVAVGSAELEQTTYTWLLAFIARAPLNTTLLLAGRPEPERWLADLSMAIPEEMQEPLEVADFTLQETELYVRYLYEQLAANPATQQTAIDLHEATDEADEIIHLHRLTRGNPIRLALYIDLFVNADPLPEVLRRPEQLATLSDAEVARLQEELDHDLLAYLARQLTEPEPQVLEYLSVMRRGLDQVRLSYLWDTTEDAAVARVLKSLERFSFIKRRGDTLYLHDEFYTIYQQNMVRQPEAGQQAERARQQDVFRRLVRFCQRRTLELTQEIYKVQDRLATLDQNSPDYLPTKDLFRRLRAERRRVRAERVHYGLYLNPVDGLNNLYFRIAGQAFLANEQDLDELLQSEVTIFFFGPNVDYNRQQTGIDQNQWKILRFHVLHERVARWIKRLTSLGLREKAQAFAERAKELHQDLAARLYPEVEDLHNDPAGALICRLFGLEWEAFRGFAAVFTGDDLARAAAELDETISRIEEELRADRREQNGLLSVQLPEFKWRLLNVLAESMEFAGFAYANLYDFKQAEQRYRRADRILDTTGFQTLQAEVKNDLSRVLGELGALHEALALCQEGLEVRKLYGFDYLRGLSLNTLALINTRSARPTRALVHAHEALKLFRQIGNSRGIGLALIQVAEARRRFWGLTAEELRSDPTRTSKIDRGLLREVEPLLQEAERLFSDEFLSPPRLIEVRIEFGCLYRDWAGFFGLAEAQEQFDKAQELLSSAMELARDNYPQHFLSACVNLAWLYAYCKMPDLAVEQAAEALGKVPASHVFNREHPIDLASATNVAYFRELSKLSSLYAVELLANSDNLEALLRAHIFAVTYLQLFSRYDPYYLSVTKRQLSRLVNRLKGRAAEVEALTAKVIGDYHLRAIEDHVGGLLQAETVIQDALNRSGLPDYLD